MNKIKIILSLILAITSPAHAQLRDVTPGVYSQGFFSTPNYVRNPNCFANTANITASGGSLTRTTSAPVFGSASCLIDASASAQTYKFSTNTLDNGLNGQNCEARFTYTGDGSLYKAYVEQPAATKVSAEVTLQDASSQSKTVSIFYPCGSNASASLLTIEATSNSAAAIKVGQAYLGQATGIGTVDPVGEWQTWTPTGSWVTNTTYSGRWRRVGENIEYQIRVATSGAPTAVALTVNLPNGHVMDAAKFPDSGTGNNQRLSQAAGRVHDAGTNFHDAFVDYNSSTSVILKVSTTSATYGTVATISSGVPMTWASGDDVQVSFSAPIVGLASQSAVRPDTQALQPAGEVMAFAGATCPTGWLTADGSAVSRSTYAQLFNRIASNYGSGDGSTTFNLPDLRWSFIRGRGPAISVTGSGSASSNNATFNSHGINRTGVKVRLSSGTLSGLSTATDYWAIVVDANTLAFASSRANAISGSKVAISGANSAVIVQYEDPDVSSRVALAPGGNTGANVGSYQADDYKSHSHNYDAGGNAHFVLRTTGGALGLTTGAVQANSATGTQASGGNETRPSNVTAVYCVRAYDLSQMAPVLVGSVTSNSTGAIRTESFFFSGNAGASANCTGSPCTVNSNTGGVGSVTRGGTGTYTANFTPAFSATPVCTCSGNQIGTGYIACAQSFSGSSTSAASILLAADATVSVTCTGQR